MSKLWPANFDFLVRSLDKEQSTLPLFRCVCVCASVGNPESKGVSRGATAHLPMLPNEAMEDVVEGFMDA